MTYIKIHWNELRKHGFEFQVWLLLKLAAVKSSLNNVAAKVIAKQVTKIYFTQVGSIIAASLGYIVMKKVAET